MKTLLAPLSVLFSLFSFFLFASPAAQAMLKCTGMSDCPRMHDCYWGYCCKIKATGGGIAVPDAGDLPNDLQAVLKKNPNILNQYPLKGAAPPDSVVKTALSGVVVPAQSSYQPYVISGSNAPATSTAAPVPATAKPTDTATSPAKTAPSP